VPNSLDDLLDAGGGVAARTDLLTVVSRAALDDKIRRGELSCLFPRAYARPWDADLPDVQLRAALASVGGEVALSHVTAVDRWDLPVPPDGPIHVTAYNPRHPRGIPGRLVVHRTLLPLDAVTRNGMPTVRPELALMTSWPLLAGPIQRAPLIEACRRRLANPARLLELAERMWWLGQLPAVRELVGLLLAGCQSELELWGYTDVFTGPGLADATRQLRVVVDGATYRLDMAYEAEKLAVELDGRAYHSSDEQRERDERRDIALAKLGWQTLRLSHFRLHNDVEGCRRDVLAVRAARRLLVG
jgi:REase_MTES_1575